MGYLLQDDLFSDFVIDAADKQFKVHKCVIANKSSVLKTMLTCGLDETKNNSTAIDCDPIIFEYFLKFIYEGTFPTIDQMKTVLCCDLYELAHRYEVQILLEICNRYVLQLDVKKDDALKVYEFAGTYKFEDLLKLSWDIIKR